MEINHTITHPIVYIFFCGKYKNINLPKLTMGNGMGGVYLVGLLEFNVSLSQ